jgi:hypothetical protein
LFFQIFNDVRNFTKGTEDWEAENIERKNEFKLEIVGREYCVMTAGRCPI